MRTTRQQVLIETHATRQQAVELLKALQHAHAECEAHLKSEQRSDVVKTVTGRSSVENAIASTRRMIESLDRAVEEARCALSDADQGFLDEIDEPGVSEEAEVRVRIGPASQALPARRYA